MRLRSALRAAALLGGFMLLLSACQPLYFPLVPETSRPQARVQLEVQLALADGRPELDALVLRVPEPGWVAIQWFAPDNREAASESIWLDEDSVGQRVSLPLPADVTLVSGTWRALLSRGPVVLRQLSIEVP